MSRRARPTAFDVSFPDEASDVSRSSLAQDTEDDRASIVSRASSSKRKERDEGLDALPSAVKRKLAATKPGTTRIRNDTALKLQYAPGPNDIYEKADTVILGEEPDDAGQRDLPVRVLTDFCIFDRKDDFQFCSLNDENLRMHVLEAAGFVSPVYANEEDEGQEDDVEEDLQRLRTSTIQQYSLDYESRDDPLYIQTKYAWYQLRRPSDAYLSKHLEFYRAHRVTQVLISSAKDNRNLEYDELVEATTRMKDPLLGVKITSEDYLISIPLIVVVLSEIQDGERLRRVPAVRRILAGNIPLHSPAPPIRTRGPKPRPPIQGQKKLDLAVLQAGNQNPTRVTPFIDKLARGWFNERLRVVGVKLPPDLRESEAKRAYVWMLERLGDYIDRQAKMERSKKTHLDSYANADRIANEYWRAVTVDGVRYSVGDVVLTPRGNYEQRRERAAHMPKTLKNIPDDALISDFFWFGRIVHINQQRRKMHLQWFDHAPRSILEELADPRELFLWNSCGEISANDAYGKVKVQYRVQPDKTTGAYLESRAEPSIFYCNYICDETMASFTSITQEQLLSPRNLHPPDNCPPCLLLSQQEQERMITPIRDGIAYRGHNFHKYDFVLCNNADAGPAHIGQILRLISSRGRNSAPDSVLVRVLGRIGDIISICPERIVKDERHLFITDETDTIPISDLIAPCFVVTDRSLSDDQKKEAWLSTSATHYYVRYRFPTAKPEQWSERIRLTCDDLPVCHNCYRAEQARDEAFEDFVAAQKRRPLRTFDPFSGVGAFSLAMEATGCMKTHQAVEISPSAAQALRKNSPQTVVYNQCSNIVLEYAIKSDQGHKPEVPKEIGHTHQRLPDPPKPGSADVIVAGFPCQPHSRLNMFQHANDRKSHLILNLLSWVDFLRPKYCVFENVRGFLRYNLHAYQAGKHRLEGGVEMGGLKFLIRALLAMRYQVQFGLLQAGHYGTPQARVRFFLLAAKDGCVLPSLPQPTHDFPVVDALEMKFANEAKAQPLQTSRGVAPHSFVSIEDAIEDLPRFHWKLPEQCNNASGDNIPEIPCDHQKLYCGYAGPNVDYQHPPTTSYQVACRKGASADLQHYTKVPPAKTVRRVINIPLTPKADYRSLPSRDWEWQAMNPSSATARHGYRPGLYGRLNKYEWFNTTVTNVDPTAKQSWVLNPWCKRMVTVRELARSQGFPDRFVFYAIDGDVKTLHRQIGNAVPWPIGAALGRQVLEAAFATWKADKHSALTIDDDDDDDDD